MRKLLLALGLITLTSSANAAVIAYTWEENGDLLTQYSGTLDLSGMSQFQSRTQSTNNTFQPFRTIFFRLNDYVGYSPATVSNTGPGALSPTRIGTTASSVPFVGFGDQFGYGVNGNGVTGHVYVANGYVSGTEINGGGVIANGLLSDLGISAPATANFTWSGDSITHFYGVAPPTVPLPAGLPLVAAGLGALAWLRRRKSSATT